MSTSELLRMLEIVGSRAASDDELRPLLVRLLACDGPTEHDAVVGAAYEAKVREVGRSVYLRGLIEWSNVCVKDCFYCGIRRSNGRVVRYTMTKEEIVAAAVFAAERRMGSIVLQSGERSDPAFVDFVEDVLEAIGRETGGALAVTLSLGEQSAQTYRRWRTAGATRYLLRMESSDAALYARLHPRSHAFATRLRCLSDLREAGYIVGSGVLIGVPGQTLTHLASDLLFFRSADLDMVGMGPYVVHRDTPLAAVSADDAKARERRFRLALRMIALTRLLLQDVNIAAATALQALHPRGRELALLSGANVIMPVVTAKEYRQHYRLYDDRPCTEETAEQCHSCLDVRIASVGESIVYGVPGDPAHFVRAV